MYRASEIPLTAPLPAVAESFAGREISSFFGESGTFAELGRELRFPLTAPLPAYRGKLRQTGNFLLLRRKHGFRRVGTGVAFSLTAPLPAAAESDAGRVISSFFGESGAFAE